MPIWKKSKGQQNDKGHSMAAISGQGGAVKNASVVVANLDSWDLSLGAGVVDTTTFQSPGAWKTSTATVKDWSGKSTGRFDGADTTGQVTLINGLGNTFVMSFMTDAVHNWSGSAILTKITPKSDAGGVVTAEFDFTGTGPCVYA